MNLLHVAVRWSQFMLLTATLIAAFKLCTELSACLFKSLSMTPHTKKVTIVCWTLSSFSWMLQWSEEERASQACLIFMAGVLAARVTCSKSDKPRSSWMSVWMRKSLTLILAPRVLMEVDGSSFIRELSSSKNSGAPFFAADPSCLALSGVRGASPDSWTSLKVLTKAVNNCLLMVSVGGHLMQTHYEHWENRLMCSKYMYNCQTGHPNDDQNKIVWQQKS